MFMADSLSGFSHFFFIAEPKVKGILDDMQFLLSHDILLVQISLLASLKYK